MNIKEMANNHYKDGKFISGISQDELNKFVSEFVLISKLKDKYNYGDCNRKELGKEILVRIENLKILMDIFEIDLRESKHNYEYPEYISDYNRIFELILQLLNKGESKYTLKKFYAEQLGSFETMHGDRESSIIQGEIWIISKKSVLDNLDNTKPYYGANFGTLVSKIINDGNSVVITTNHCYQSNVMPYSINSSVDIHKFKLSELISDLCCYTYEDELGIVIKELNKYIDTYGGNIDNVSIDTLISRIEKFKKGGKQKLLSKEK